MRDGAAMYGFAGMFLHKNDCTAKLPVWPRGAGVHPPEPHQQHNLHLHPRQHPLCDKDFVINVFHFYAVP